MAQRRHGRVSRRQRHGTEEEAMAVAEVAQRRHGRGSGVSGTAVHSVRERRRWQCHGTGDEDMATRKGEKGKFTQAASSREHSLTSLGRGTAS